MHELGATEQLLALALRHAEAENAAAVTDLHVVIGDLASLVDDSIQFYWDIISRGTLCEQATLHFTRLPTRLQCQTCRQTHTPDGDLAPCPTCQSAHLVVVGGREFYLDSIDIQV